MGIVRSRCSSNLYPPQPGTSTAAREEPSAGTHQALRRTLSVLWNSTSSYPSPTDAGGDQGEHAAGLCSQLPAVMTLEDYLHRRRTDLLSESDREGSTLSEIRCVLLAVHEDALGRRDTAQLQPYLLAHGDERALAFAEADGNAAFRGLARDSAPGVLTLCVPEPVPGILVDCGFSFTLVRVDQQCQRVDRLLAGMGRIRPHRDGSICLYVEGRFAEGCVCQDVNRPFETLATVVVEPGARGQVDVAVLDAGPGYGGDEEGVA